MNLSTSSWDNQSSAATWHSLQSKKDLGRMEVRASGGDWLVAQIIFTRWGQMSFPTHNQVFTPEFNQTSNCMPQQPLVTVAGRMFSGCPSVLLSVRMCYIKWGNDDSSYPKGQCSTWPFFQNVLEEHLFINQHHEERSWTQYFIFGEELVWFDLECPPWNWLYRFSMLPGWTVNHPHFRI